MTNLTLSIDGDLLKRARICALERDTSVNAMVRDYLEELAGPATQQDAIREFLELAAKSRSGSGPEGRKWTRDELYER
jgi:predicted transcriptional regulator